MENGYQIISDMMAGREKSPGAIKVGGFEVEEMTSFPPNENPFCHDFFHMGTQIGNNLTVMYCTDCDKSVKYLIIINMVTGERLKVHV